MLRSIFGRKSKSTSSKPRSVPSPFAKLRVEMLEDRLTPANLTWLGVYTAPVDFANSANWWNQQSGGYQVPTANDDLYFVGLQTATVATSTFVGDGEGSPPPTSPPPTSPPPSGPLYLLPPLPFGANPNANATIPTSLLTLKSVHLVSNYTGHVSASDNQHLGTLDLQTGSFDQLGAGDGMNDLSITTYLGFLGGTLNSTTNTGTLHITGSTAGAATANLLPPDNGSLTIGSTLSLEGLGTETGGAGMAQFGGDYFFSNGAGIHVADFSAIQLGGLVQVNSEPNTPSTEFKDVAVIKTTPGQNGLTVYTVESKGLAISKGFKGDIRLDLNGSLIVVEDSKFTVNTPAGGSSVNIGTQGFLLINGGANVTTNKGINDSGSIRVAPVAAAENKPLKATAFIGGALTVNEFGSLHLEMLPPNPERTNRVSPATLSLTGDVVILGKFYADVDISTSTSGTCSLVQTTETLTFGENSNIIISPYTTTERNNASVGQFWLPARAERGIIDRVPKIGDDYTATLTDTSTILRVTVKQVPGGMG